ncbi:uncharacterized protein zgc:113229 [Thalassophryne amazonica]|uniref:uncharacterized protein zgc:113229 n=1 Tax=Thalassophryne amazonica TaxID=390379 RepID=UPI0014722426|nr:uncharacterized protein zgc:113229 [Thalassophryne amazonica]
MFQTHTSGDNQALLQSMLQRLKIQPARESQASLNTPVPTTAPSTCLQDGERETTDPKSVDTVTASPQNGFESKEERRWGFGRNGIPSKLNQVTKGESGDELRTPGDGQDASSLNGKGQQTTRNYEYNRSVISFSSQKDNTDSDNGGNGILGNTALPKPTAEQFPVESFKDTSVSVFGGNSVDFSLGKNICSEKVNVTTMGQNQDHSQTFAPRVHRWSLNSKDTRSQENKVHAENGDIRTLAENKNMTVVPASQKTTHNSWKRKQRLSETKMKRWTQKIKERWWDRPGSFSKKGKEDNGKLDVNNMPENQNSPKNQQLMEERTPPSLDTRDLSEASSGLSEELANNGEIRPISDSEFGLGSFSLLEEIVTGQEWAKFLKPTLSDESTDQKPSEETAIQFSTTPNAQEHDRGESLLNMNQDGDGTYQWSFSGGTKSQFSGFANAPVSPAAFLPVNMETSEAKKPAVQGANCETDQSEPMEHSRTQSVTEPDNIGIRHLTTPKKSSYKKPVHIPDNSVLKSRIQQNRKRVYEAQNMETENEESISPVSTKGNRVIDETRDPPKPSLPPSSPSYPNYCMPPPRSVLKHSISQDYSSSMETVSKKRRVEENRRVRFSEEVVSIEPAELDMDGTGSEDDSGADDDSVIEEESEEELHTGTEELAPARRTALPAWIQALKRKNPGRKWRY